MAPVAKCDPMAQWLLVFSSALENVVEARGGESQRELPRPFSIAYSPLAFASSSAPKHILCSSKHDGKAPAKVCFYNRNGCFEGGDLAIDIDVCAPGHKSKFCPNQCTTAAVWVPTPPIAPFTRVCSARLTLVTLLVGKLFNM